MFEDKEASWPVTNEEPLDLVAEPGLTPGPALLSCSGSDIHLSKGASTRPNAEKQKGRYVMMLPGMLSFRRQSQQNGREDNNKQEGKSESESQNEDGDTQKTGQNKVNKESSPNNPPSAKLANATTVLGRIKGLKSGKPTMTIPYPNGGILTLKGQQIESSSRFMMLNFKRGKVTCKDAVSSVLVFGEPTWSGDEPIPYSNDSNEASLEHYGGSERTIDGGRTVKFRKSRNAPIFVKQQSNKKSGKTPASGLESVDPKEEDSEEEDSDAYIEAGVGDSLSRGASKTLSRRSSRSCASKEISYGDKSSEEEDSSDENSSEEEKEEEPNEKSTWRRKRNSQQNKKYPSQRTSSSKKTVTKVINLSDDEDDSYSYLDGDGKIPPSSQISDSSGRRSSRVRKQISYGDKGSDEESSEEGSSDDKEIDAQKGAGAKRGKSLETKNKRSRKSTISLKGEEVMPKEKSTRQRKTNSKQKLSQSTKLSSKEKKSNNDTLELSEDDSDESYLKGDGKVQGQASTPSSGKRSSRVRKRISYGDKGSEEDDETSNEEQSSDEEEDAQKENIKTGATKKRGRRNVNNNKKTTAKSKAKGRTVIEIDDSPPEKKKSASKKGKTSSDPINIDDDNAKEKDDANVKSPTKVIKHQVTAAKSPGRRRRRRSASTATTPPLSCSNRAKSKKKRKADDFNFDFTEEDEAIMTTPERKRMKKM
mmetsp:Transcript_28556/g.43159  ORF Transcript_28556/g.43159 Transcript_28556/m.43159 type:complete len:704 (+) Transcript_28556:95-2206(+)